MDKRTKSRAFTLVEIMITILIIGILLGIAIPNYVNAREQSRKKACVENLRRRPKIEKWREYLLDTVPRYFAGMKRELEQLRAEQRR